MFNSEKHQFEKFKNKIWGRLYDRDNQQGYWK